MESQKNRSIVNDRNQSLFRKLSLAVRSNPPCGRPTMPSLRDVICAKNATDAMLGAP
jgi:hypothetical protein